jgi:hypothetical protein
VGEKEKGQGPSSKTVIPFLPSVQNRGGDWWRPAGRLRRLPASRGSTAAGDRGKRKRGRGLSTSVLTLVGDGLRRWLHGKGRPTVEVVGGGADGGGDGALGRCWRLEDGVGSGEKVVPAFYRRRRSVRGGDISGGEVAGGGGAWGWSESLVAGRRDGSGRGDCGRRVAAVGSL